MKRFIFSFIILYPIFCHGNAACQESDPFSQAKFVPDISLILDAGYLQRSLPDERYSDSYRPGSLGPVSGGDGSEIKNGFFLNYGELGISSVVDPYFTLNGIFHITTSGFELEEGYFSTRSLPYGIRLKGGKFLSSFGRISDQHSHSWNFNEMPLLYSSFFGSEGLNELGLQLNWIVPTDHFIQIGLEALQGNNENSFGRNGFGNSAAGIDVSSSPGPGVATLFAKTSFETDEMILLLGGSGIFGKTRKDDGMAEGNDAFYLNTSIINANLTLKYLFDSNRQLTFQGEYLRRLMDGYRYHLSETGEAVTERMNQKNAGFYAELVGQLSKYWRTGLRYDMLVQNDINRDGTMSAAPENIPVISAMLEYLPTEFSRLRLQYNYDKSRYSTSSRSEYLINNEISISINLAIGAHGAHQF